MHFLCVGTPQKPGEYAADLRHVDAAVARSPRTCAGRAWSSEVDRPGGHRARLADALARSRPAGADVELAWNPEFLREGFAVRTRCGRTGSSRRRLGAGRAACCGRCTRRCSTRASRSSSPTYRPPSWSRSPPTRSWPRRSRSSTRWPRSARPPGPTSRSSPRRWRYDARIGGRFLRAGLGFGGGCLPKDIRAFLARAGELGVDQALAFLREVDAINMRRRPGWSTSPASSARRVLGRAPYRRARRRVQAGLRRRARLPRAGRRRQLQRAWRAGHRLRPGGNRQRPASLPDARLRRPRRSRPPAAPTSCCT